MSDGNELLELYDCLSVLYDSLPEDTHEGWKNALSSVLYGGEFLADDAVCYGKQQNDRNYVTRRSYTKWHGNGDRIIEFNSITVAQPRPADREHLPSGAVVPVAPISGEPLPAFVSLETLGNAVSLLNEFPAEPAADRSGNGAEQLLDQRRVSETRRLSLEAAGQSSDETTLLFVSDTHLGYENRRRVGRGNTVSWFNDISTTDAFIQVRNLARRRDVDAVVHCGDILDHEVDPETLRSAENDFLHLEGHSIPVYFVLGSHDHDSHSPRGSNSVNGIRWLKEQQRAGRVTELTTDPTPITDSPVDLYGISEGNVGLDDVGTYASRSWAPEQLTFGTPRPGPNVLCLHGSFTPYRSGTESVDIGALLKSSSVSFNLVLVGDEHSPKYGSFESGYTFEAPDGTPIRYTGPAVPISRAYKNRVPFVTELTLRGDEMTETRHEL